MAALAASPSSIVLTGGLGAASGTVPDTPSSADAAVEKLAKRARTRTKVAREIESTEVSFVESMEALVKLYIAPLQAAVAADDDPILTSEEIATLFSNIATITALNKKFLTDYSERIAQWDNDKTLIGDIFLQSVHVETPHQTQYATPVALQCHVC